MLDLVLRSDPLPKVILIKDTFQSQARDLLKYLLRSCANSYHGSVDVLKYSHDKRSIIPEEKASNIDIHDFCLNSRGWITEAPEPINIWTVAAIAASKNGVLIIDSLSQMIYQYGLHQTYKIIHHFKVDKEIKQVIILFHTDITEDLGEVLNFFDQLATLSIKMEPKFHSDKKRRLSYVLKKSSGKIISEIEHYYFVDGEFKSESIEKLDIQSLIEDKMKDVVPEELSTFKIGLNDSEKMERAKVILPYLPTDKKGLTIHYQMDNMDDWDDEDPDDDLDI